MEHSSTITDAIWTQFGASLDMLENSIKMCPDENWDTALDFWYIAYHCIFWTDYYLTIEPHTFAPPPPFTFSEFDPSGKKPDCIYTQTEVIEYLEHCRRKAYQLISALSLNQLNDRWVNDYKDFSLLEVLLYNMRHVQHHAAQLNLLLRQTIDNAPNWVGQAKKMDKE